VGTSSGTYKWNHWYKGSISQTGVTKSVEGGKSYFGTQLKNEREIQKTVNNIKKS
jgi:hypothetical protein